MTPMVRFQLLGSVMLHGPQRSIGVVGSQPAVLLARMVLDYPRPLLHDEAEEMLWASRSHSPGVLRHVVTRARRALVGVGLPPSTLVSRSRATYLDIDGFELDVHEVGTAVAEAEEALGEGRPAVGWERASSALALVRHPLLPGCEGTWADHWREKVGGLHQRALWAASAAATRTGQHASGVALANDAVALDVMDEHSTRLLMSALAAAGQRPKALAAYERCRRLLDEELGVRPSDLTEQAYLDILGRAPEAVGARVGVRW